MVDAWNSSFLSARMFGLLDDNKEDWLGLTLFAQSTLTRYKVGLKPSGWIIVAEKPERFFPLQWSRVCLSLDSGIGSMMLVVDGNLLGQVVYDSEKDPNRPENLNVILGQNPATKGGVPGPDAPKIQALPEWGGGSDPCLDFCEGFVHMH